MSKLWFICPDDLSRGRMWLHPSVFFFWFEWRCAWWPIYEPFFSADVFSYDLSFFRALAKKYEERVRSLVFQDSVFNLQKNHDGNSRLPMVSFKRLGGGWWGWEFYSQLASEVGRRGAGCCCCCCGGGGGGGHFSHLGEMIQSWLD